MYESGYYPPGAEHDPNAPYNQRDPEPIEYDACVSVCLSKSTKLSTQYYETDEDEECCYISHTPLAPKDDYKELCYSLPSMFKEFIDLMNEKLQDPNLDRIKRWKYQSMIEDISGWVVDDLEVIEE